MFRCRERDFGETGAGGENRTHDLPLTKGLRYHYATPALRGFPEGRAYSLGVSSGKGRMKAQSTVRKQRLAAALRANLRRRKGLKANQDRPSPVRHNSAEDRPRNLETAIKKE
jgi:hypothetical protein